MTTPESKSVLELVQEIAMHCPCGHRPESPKTHPHMPGCPVQELEAALPAHDRAVRAAALEEIAVFAETHYCIIDVASPGGYKTYERSKHPNEPFARAIRALAQQPADEITPAVPASDGLRAALQSILNQRYTEIDMMHCPFVPGSEQANAWERGVKQAWEQFDLVKNIARDALAGWREKARAALAAAPAPAPPYPQTGKPDGEVRESLATDMALRWKERYCKHFNGAYCEICTANELSEIFARIPMDAATRPADGQAALREAFIEEVCSLVTVETFVPQKCPEMTRTGVRFAGFALKQKNQRTGNKAILRAERLKAKIRAALARPAGPATAPAPAPSIDVWAQATAEEIADRFCGGSETAVEAIVAKLLSVPATAPAPAPRDAEWEKVMAAKKSGYDEGFKMGLQSLAAAPAPQGEGLLREIILDFLNNEECFCVGTNQHPCPRCQVTIDEARAALAQPAGSVATLISEGYCKKCGKLILKQDVNYGIHPDAVCACFSREHEGA